MGISSFMNQIGWRAITYFVKTPFPRTSISLMFGGRLDKFVLTAVRHLDNNYLAQYS